MSKGGHGGESNPLRGCAEDIILLAVKSVPHNTLFFALFRDLFGAKSRMRVYKAFFQPITTRSVVKFEIKQYNTGVLQNFEFCNTPF